MGERGAYRYSTSAFDLPRDPMLAKPTGSSQIVAQRKIARQRAGSRHGVEKAMAPGVGFEPTTDRLTVDCSTAELPRNNTGHVAAWAGYNGPNGLVNAIFSRHGLLAARP